MRSARFVLLLVVTFTVGTACNNPTTQGPSQVQPATSASPQTSATADEFAASRAVFKDTCAKCHGENAAGGRVQIEGREIKVPNLTGEHARKTSDEDMVDKITNGEDDMPAFKDKLTPQQIQEMIKFIRKEFHGR